MLSEYVFWVAGFNRCQGFIFIMPKKNKFKDESGAIKGLS